MDTSVVVSLVVALGVIAALWIGGRVLLRRLAEVDDERGLNPARITSEHLHRLPPPQWRLVLEIDDPNVPGVDQIVIGPCGVLAINTQLGDRPLLDHAAIDHPDGARAAAAAAITRGPIDDLLAGLGMTCHRLVHVYWGTPDPQRAASIPVIHATVAVDGPRLDDWIRSLPTDVLAPHDVDLAWQTITTGLGRPDPLAS